mmetsp:Transcript_9294/g.12002  ORF Transcript_9294/g.12002 Transcript_9294/m.12002 type:complete len:99 (-) Transcript_9294:579-875(-)
MRTGDNEGDVLLAALTVLPGLAMSDAAVLPVPQAFRGCRVATRAGEGDTAEDGPPSNHPDAIFVFMFEMGAPHELAAALLASACGASLTARVPTATFG